jgi:phage gpG-like protein
VGIEITVDTKNADHALARVGKTLDTRTFLKLMGQTLLFWIDRNFKKWGTEEKWRPLSPNTLAGRRGRGAAAQPLRDTGRMAMSFVTSVQGDALNVGTTDKKARWHHFGTAPRTITTKPAGRPSRKNTRRPGALVFMTPAGPVFRREVRHPGIPARRLWPSEALAERLTRETFDRFVEVVLRGQG